MADKNTQPNPKSRGLGRGLNALFEDEEGVYPQTSSEGEKDGQSADGARRPMLGIDQIERNPQQPRQMFDENALQELADSIAEHGILQPILVRPDPGGSNIYQIVAGERRWQAAQKAQLHEVPVIIKELDDATAFEIALIENLQREDLDPIDEAQGYQRLIEEYGHTQEQLGKALGKSRSHIANMIRLLALPDIVQDLLAGGDLSMGHARALITAKNPEALAREVVDKGLSVRQTEKLAAEDSGRSIVKRKPNVKNPLPKDTDTLALEKDMSNLLGMKVSIDSPDGKSGLLAVEFKSLDQLDNLLQRLSGDPGKSGARLTG